jgi:PilZ domain
MTRGIAGRPARIALTIALYLGELELKARTIMDRRLDTRWQTQVYGSILVGRNWATISITEISVKGCRLQGSLRDFRIGDAVVVSIAGLGPLEATVRWSSADNAGVEFQDRLEQAAVTYLTAFCRTAA